MKFWLDTPCREMTDKLLLDEHRSIHAYWNGMIKNPNKWVRHSILGPMDPYVMFNRHTEEVNEMLRRGWSHNSPMHEAVRSTIDVWRVSHDLHLGEFLQAGGVHLDKKMRDLQRQYLKDGWWIKKDELE